jgi:hypothetical protein
MALFGQLEDHNGKRHKPEEIIAKLDVIEMLADLFLLCGVPAHICSDQGPKFIAQAVNSWISAVGARTERGSPTLRESQIVIEGWR